MKNINLVKYGVKAKGYNRLDSKCENWEKDILYNLGLVLN